MTKTNLRIVHISDIHLGHRKTPTENTYHALQTYVYPEIENADIFISAGDMFDQSLNLDNNSSLIALQISEDLKRISREHNVKMRFLRGTYTHDRHQNNIFINTNIDNLDIKYYSSISIEYISDLGIYVLYMPDNLPYKHKDQALEYVRELLYTNGISKVDLVVGHGYFTHVLPFGININHHTFDYTDFISITNGPILMGHVHQHSVYKNIIYNGSFNRLNHGEEAPKGFGILDITEGSYDYRFIENKESVLYNTLTLQGENIDVLMNDIDNYISENFTVGVLGHLRVKHSSSEIRQSLLYLLKEKYPYIVTTAMSTVESEIKQAVDMSFIDCEYVEPTTDNLGVLIYEFLLDKRRDINVSSVISVEKINTLLEIN